MILQFHPLILCKSIADATQLPGVATKIVKNATPSYNVSARCLSHIQAPMFPTFPLTSDLEILHKKQSHSGYS